MHILGLDLCDDGLSGIPHRITKMYVKEISSGLNPTNQPDTVLFLNKYDYNEMFSEKALYYTRTVNIILCPLLEKYTQHIFQLGMLSDCLK